VLTLTCTIALGDFTHVVTGGAETFLLVFAGQTGGTALFALPVHAQVRQEL
jgi:hypothetical protein